MQTLALLLIGFSLFSALSLALTHFRCSAYQGQTTSQILGLILLAALAGLQWQHYQYLQYTDFAAVHDTLYRVLLFSVAPAFYLFSKPLLHAQQHFHPLQLLHLCPVLIAAFLPHDIALPLSFAIGAGYLLWLAKSLYALRVQRTRFKLEIAILGAVFIIALLVMVLGLSLPMMPDQVFYTLYASAIGCAFLLVSIALSFAPQLSEEVVEAARETYANSTLSNIDCDASLQQLQTLMEQENLYQQQDLALSSLAERMGLTHHQLSELINTRLGKGFSRYIREYRVEAAKTMLLDEPNASVLSVGLSVGFTSQSNFYDAFREITGITPGQFRKLNAH